MNKFYLIVKVYKSGFRRICKCGYMNPEQVKGICEQVSFNPNIVAVEVYTCEEIIHTTPERINLWED